MSRSSIACGAQALLAADRQANQSSALACLDEAEKICDEYGSPSLHLRIAISRVEWALEGDDPDRARAALRESVDRFDEGSATPDQQQAQKLLGI